MRDGEEEEEGGVFRCADWIECVVWKLTHLYYLCELAFLQVPTLPTALHFPSMP